MLRNELCMSAIYHANDSMYFVEFVWALRLRKTFVWLPHMFLG